MRYVFAGESHGPCLTAIVEDVPAGLKISEEQINVVRSQFGSKGAREAEELLKRLAYTDEYVETALRRIVAASDTKLSIEELADEMMISASYLSRRFKQSTGQTFLDTLNTQRVKRAAALLKNGGRTSEVAEKTGFSDYKHFCAVFKRYTGMTPRDFGKRK